MKNFPLLTLLTIIVSLPFTLVAQDLSVTEKKEKECTRLNEEDKLDEYEDCLKELENIQERQKDSGLTVEGIFPDHNLVAFKDFNLIFLSLANRSFFQDGNSTSGISLGLDLHPPYEGGQLILGGLPFTSWSSILKAGATLNYRKFNLKSIQTLNVTLGNFVHAGLTEMDKRSVRVYSGVELSTDEQSAELSALNFEKTYAVAIPAISRSFYVMGALKANAFKVISHSKQEEKKHALHLNSAENKKIGAFFVGARGRLGFAPKVLRFSEDGARVYLDMYTEGKIESFLLPFNLIEGHFSNFTRKSISVGTSIKGTSPKIQGQYPGLFIIFKAQEETYRGQGAKEQGNYRSGLFEVGLTY